MTLTYSVSIGSLTGGSITNPTTATAGTTINLTITPDFGMQLKAGTLKYNDGTTTIGSLTGDSITASPTSATSGSAITLTVTPDAGKQFLAGSMFKKRIAIL